MSWIRKNPIDTAAFGAIALGVLMLVWVLVPMLIPDNDTPKAEISQPPLAAPYSSIDGLPLSDPDGDDGASVESRTSSGLNGAGLTMAGLGGEGGVRGLPKHRLTITITSSAPIGTVGYIIPTSLQDDYGIVKDVGRSWSISTTVYGDPDYAQGFAQSGARGNPVTCTITVDGRVTDRRVTEGPYGQLFCQG